VIDHGTINVMDRGTIYVIDRGTIYVIDCGTTNCVNAPFKLLKNVNVPSNDKNTLHKIIKIKKI